MSGVYHKTEQMTWTFRSGSLEELGRQVDDCVRGICEGWRFSDVSVGATVEHYRHLKTTLGYEATVWAERADDD